MKITDIPKEVYEAALAYEELESWGVERADEAYNKHKEEGNVSDGLEKAVKDYLCREGEFCGNGRFGDVEYVLQIED